MQSFAFPEPQFDCRRWVGGRRKQAPFTHHALNSDTSIGTLIVPGDASYANGDREKWNNWAADMQPVLSRVPFYG
jgi:hypothetical protein